jgi:bacterioferritin-associated ferredoxin
LKAIFKSNFAMYVCVCLAVTEREIDRAIDQGACSMAEVMRCTGAGTRCGTCRVQIADKLEEAASGPASGPRHLPVLPQLPSVA